MIKLPGFALWSIQHRDGGGGVGEGARPGGLGHLGKGQVDRQLDARGLWKKQALDEVGFYMAFKTKWTTYLFGVYKIVLGFEYGFQGLTAFSNRVRLWNNWWDSRFSMRLQPPQLERGGLT